MDCCHLLPDSVDMGLIVVDGEGRIRLWNRWIEERAGILASQVCGVTLGEAFGPHVDPRVALVVREALDFGWSARLSHALHPMPLPLYPPGAGRGERMKQSLDITPVPGDGGPRCLIQVRDVTETVRREALLKQQSRQLRLDLQRLSRAQVELQRSEMRFRELARQAPAGLFEADANACCTFLNARCEQILGHSLENAAGTPWINLLPAGEQARVRGQRAGDVQRLRMGVEGRAGQHRRRDADQVGRGPARRVGVGPIGHHTQARQTGLFS